MVSLWHLRRTWISIRRNWRSVFGLCFLALIIFLIVRYKFWGRSEKLLGTEVAEQQEPKKIKAEEAQTSPAIPKVKVEVYMESRCPDTTSFINNQLWPAWAAIKNIMDLDIIPFGKAHCDPHGVDDFTCSCQHLERECELNQLMNCVIDQVKSPDIYLPIIRCLQGRDLHFAGEPCLREAGLSPAPLIQCATGKRGRQLLAAAGKRTKALNPRLHFVPWVVINGKRNEESLYHFKEAMCNSYRGTPKPEACGG